MDPNVNTYTTLTEGGIKDALIEARGDIFIAAQLLGVTALRIDRSIRVSPLLQVTQESIQSNLDAVSASSQRIAKEQLNTAIESRLSLYRVVGLDALHDLAVMDHGDNSALAQVRLGAASRLAGSTEGLNGGGEIGDALRSLNELYHREAPRIRVVRERLTVEMNGPEIREERQLLQSGD